MTGLGDKQAAFPAVPPGLAEPSMLDVLTPLLRLWKLVLGVPIGAGIVAAVLALLLPPAYTAKTTFVPAAGAGGTTLPGNFASLATQFGLNVSSGTGLSPDFFAEVLNSRELLQATLHSSFADPRKPGSLRSLLELLDLNDQGAEHLMDEGIRRLAKDISQRVDRRTGIVTLSVNSRYPKLAAAVANRMVELLNKFNLERLQSQSRERRRFAGERKDEAERELRAAEQEHLRFLQSNRRFADSPLLSFEESRLGRQVQLRQEVFQTLTREYEEARIAEVRDTPLLTIIDAAVPPDRRSFPQRKLIVFLAIVAGGLTALALVYFGEYQRAAALAGGTRYRNFVQAWGEATSQFRATFRIGRPR